MIKTASGREYECAFCGTASVGVLYIVLPNVTMSEAATVFGNSNETIELSYGDTVYKNYTVMLNLVREGNNAVRLSLRRPFVGE